MKTPAKSAPSSSRTPLAKRSGASGPLAHEIRIIGGQWKRTKLRVADKPGLRPTPGRVRETLFNWLGQDLTGWRCIDVFAGTGALGLEAASRGAADVLLCEQDMALVAQLKALQAKLGATMVRIERGDGLGALRRAAPGSLHLVLLDPPFESPLYEPALQAASLAMAPQGLVYLEAPKTWTEEELMPLGLHLHRHGKAGAVHFHLLSRRVPADATVT